MSLDPLLLLAALHPEGEVFSVCAFGGKDGDPPWFRFASSPKEAVDLAAEADRLKGREGVYHCVQNLKAKTANGRGGELDAKNVWAVWADVDAMHFPPFQGILDALPESGKGVKAAKNKVWSAATQAERQQAINAALAAIDKLPIGTPSAIVASGRGYHPYWLLTESSEDLALVKGVNAKIAELLDADNCADLARVLKIPGTRNRKIAASPEAVPLVKFDGAIRYALADLARLLNAVPIPLATGGAGGKKDRAGKPAEPDASFATEPEDARVRRAVKYVEKIPGGVAGEGGHGQTWKAALAVVRGFDLPISVAYNVLATAYNPRCQPPWSEKDLRHKVESAAQNARVARGYLLHNGEHDKHHDVARASARFSAESVEAMESVEELYEAAESLPDLAVLAVDDPGALAAVKARLAEKFKGAFKVRDFDAAVKPLAREIQKARRSKVLRAEYGSPAAMFPDAPIPPETIMPPYWCADPVKGLGKEMPTGPDEPPRYETVCSGGVVPFIASRSIDLSDETEILDLVWPRCGAPGTPFTWRRRSIHRGDAFNNREILKLAGFGFPVNSANAMDVVRYLSDAEPMNIGWLPVKYVCSSMGWLRDRGEIVGFMWGKTLIPARPNPPDVTFNPADGGDRQIVDALHAKGAMDGWKETIAHLAPYPRAMFVVYSSFVPPVLRLLDAQNFTVDIAALTSTGKSTVQKAAASPWGLPDERSAGLIRGANMTKVFVERVASLLSGLPTILDDTKPLSDPEDLARIIYGQEGGGEKGRGSLKGIAVSRTYQSVTIFTGETPATAMTKDGGTKARVIELWGPPLGGTSPKEAAVVRAVRSGIMANYGHAGPEFVRWIIAHQDDADAWKTARLKLIDELASKAEGNSVAGRLAEHVAAVWIVAGLVHEALALPWKLDRAMLDIAWKAALEGAEDADTAQAALDHVVSWAHGHTRQFWGATDSPESPFAGRWEDGVTAPVKVPYIGFLPSVVQTVLGEVGYGLEILKTWKDRGWLVTQGGESTLVAKIDGKATRLVAIDVAAIRKAKEAPDLF